MQRLLDRLQADPAVVFAHAIERGEAATGEGGLLGHVMLVQALEELRFEA
ncbi:hypothetical protein [Luteimonas kalidii]|uniref:Uncharacterized protein n=1 Tax=Luteimonas kalidii TaxID=3042025 RepID=A0ABT6JXA9_9GAMM|nr:hypothetical protein [Luteimonas kalidii]MDH5834781.1 hypothetical protein [Luteimonas kalidii]